jgi:hypothetical protein
MVQVKQIQEMGAYVKLVCLCVTIPQPTPREFQVSKRIDSSKNM